MKTFIEWFEEGTNEKVPTGTINGSWFSERGLPMIVRCTCCESTMVLPSAFISEDGETFCSTCAQD